MFPVGHGSSAASNFLLRLRRVVAKNLSTMVLGLPDRLIRPARVLPTVVPHRPAPREELLVRPVLTELRRARLVLAVLAARGALNARVGFPVLAARPVPVDREAVLVVRPVRVAQVAAPVVLAAHLVLE